MIGNSQLLSYLAARRKLRPWLDDGVVDTTIKTILEVIGIEAQVVSTFTSHEKTVLVTLAGKSFLVLDMNQLRVLHRMNCLYFSSDQELRFSSLAIPLVVQRLRNMDLAQEAAAFLESLAESDRKCLRETGLYCSKEPFLLNILASQQYYIIAHEAAHAHASAKFDSEERRESHECSRELSIRLLMIQYGSLIESAETHIAESSAKYLRQILASHDLQEELGADSMAQYLLLTLAPKHVSFMALVQALVLVHCHLISLDRINEYLRLYQLGLKLELSEGFHEINSIRLDWCVRGIDMFTQLARSTPLAGSHLSSVNRINPEHNSNHDLIDNVQQMVNEHTRLFDKVVDEWLVASLHSLQTGNGGNIPRIKYQRSGQVPDLLKVRVDEALGWNGAPVDLDSFLKQLL